MMVFIIAEIAQAHEGSLGILHSYIDAVSTTGVDAIKFQTHIAGAESSPFEPFRVNFSREDKTRFDYWKRMEFSKAQWKDIKRHCEDAGLMFLSSPFSNAAVNLLEDIGIQKYKIGSGEVTNFLLLEKICRTGKEMMCSSGMSNFQELDLAVDFIKRHGNKLTLMQCTTKYPTPPEAVGLNVLEQMRNRYKLPIGLSDHSGTIFPCIAATALGADALEVHVTFDKLMFGPDSTSSLTINELKQMVQGVRFVETSLSHSVDKNDNSSFETLKNTFEKSLAVNKAMRKGQTITFEDLEAKKPPGHGIPAMKFREVIGRKLLADLDAYAFLTENHCHKKD